MIGFFLLILALAVGLSYFLYKNQEDRRKLQKLLHDTQVEDEEHDRTHIT